MGRQVKLAQGSLSLSLNDTTYVLQAKGGWQSGAETVQLSVLVAPTTLAERARLVGAVRQMLAAAVVYEERMAGDPVWIYTKTCDALSTTAEVGATWLRRRVRGGEVTEQPLSGTAGAPAALLQITVRVTAEPWQRAAAAPVLEVLSGPSYIAPTGAGGIQTTGDVALYARRLRWTSGTGITVRTFWQYASAGSGQINFLRLSGNCRVYWGGSAGVWYGADETGTVRAQSAGSHGYTTGQMLEVVAVLGLTSCAIYVNGASVASYSGSFSWPAAPDTYRVLETGSAGTQTFWSIQIWPTKLSGSTIAELTAWGRPASEMCYLAPPSDTKATNAVYKLYNAGGEQPAPVHLLLDGVSQDFGAVKVGYRPRRIPGRMMMECENATLGSATAGNSNADASGSWQARFTPADTSWATRVTAALVDKPADLAAAQGEYRLFLAGYDSAASVQVNQVRWRMVIAGQAGEWSDAYSFAAVSQRSLLDLGRLSLPPGNWPQETLDATTTVYGSTLFVTIEVQARNTTGSGGGTLDLDALYLAPAEAEGTAEATFDVSAADLLLDFTTAPAAAILASDPRSLEFAGWATWLGDEIALAPAAGTCGTFMLFWLRDSSGQFYPNDTCDVWFRYAPRWLE